MPLVIVTAEDRGKEKTSSTSDMNQTFLIGGFQQANNDFRFFCLSVEFEFRFRSKTTERAREKDEPFVFPFFPNEQI